MSITYQYPNATIAYSDNSGNISHIGILSSNLNGTTTLTSTSNDLPTTNTGSSIGHYHYSDPVTKSLQFLNAAGTGTGGHEFYLSTSTSEPIQTAKIDINGITVDKTTTGAPNLVNLPDITIASTTRIVFDTPINQAPWNFIGVGNPVQVLQNTANMQTGVTYYVTAHSTQLGELTLNSDGTGTIDGEDLPNFTQPILAWVNGTLPGVIQNININEEISITTDVNTSVLSSTSLTFNNVNVKMNQTVSTLIYSSPIIYADGHVPATSLSIRNTYGYSGWYYKNSNPNVAPTNKINWYFPPTTPTTTPVSALKGISISFFNGVNTSNDNTLFITIYTVPTGSGDYAPGFYHSSMTYVFDQTINPTSNTNYQGVCILNPSNVPFNYETQIQYNPSTVNNPQGTYLPTDNILAVVIGTNSASPTNSVQLVVNKLNLHYNEFTQSYLLVPP